MSRIGFQPVKIPTGVTVTIEPKKIVVKGQKGELSQDYSSNILIKQAGDKVELSRKDDSKQSKSLHGLTRSLIANMITGVTEGYSKQLEINGVGFKAVASGKNLKLSLGYSHDIEYSIPEDVEASIDQNIITIVGIDKQKVGHVAAEIRALRKPEPYKGKGINYVGEYIIRKAGKAAAAVGKE